MKEEKYEPLFGFPFKHKGTQQSFVVLGNRDYARKKVSLKRRRKRTKRTSKLFVKISNTNHPSPIVQYKIKEIFYNV